MFYLKKSCLRSIWFQDMAASRKEAYVIGGFIIFFLFALLTEKIGDFKGSNSNMYVYLEENRKNNESK